MPDLVWVVNPSGKKVRVDRTQLQDALGQGYEELADVINPSGSQVMVRKSSLESAIKAGYKRVGEQYITPVAPKSDVAPPAQQAIPQATEAEKKAAEDRLWSDLHPSMGQRITKMADATKARLLRFVADPASIGAPLAVAGARTLDEIGKLPSSLADVGSLPLEGTMALYNLAGWKKAGEARTELEEGRKARAKTRTAKTQKLEQQLAARFRPEDVTPEDPIGAGLQVVPNIAKVVAQARLAPQTIGPEMAVQGFGVAEERGRPTLDAVRYAAAQGMLGGYLNQAPVAAGVERSLMARGLPGIAAVPTGIAAESALQGFWDTGSRYAFLGDKDTSFTKSTLAGTPFTIGARIGRTPTKLSKPIKPLFPESSTNLESPRANFDLRKQSDDLFNSPGLRAEALPFTKESTGLSVLQNRRSGHAEDILANDIGKTAAQKFAPETYREWRDWTDLNNKLEAQGRELKPIGALSQEARNLDAFMQPLIAEQSYRYNSINPDKPSGEFYLHREGALDTVPDISIPAEIGAINKQGAGSLLARKWVGAHAEGQPDIVLQKTGHNEYTVWDGGKPVDKLTANEDGVLSNGMKLDPSTMADIEMATGGMVKYSDNPVDSTLKSIVDLGRAERGRDVVRHLLSSPYASTAEVAPKNFVTLNPEVPGMDEMRRVIFGKQLGAGESIHLDPDVYNFYRRLVSERAANQLPIATSSGELTKDKRDWIRKINDAYTHAGFMVTPTAHLHNEVNHYVGAIGISGLLKPQKQVRYWERAADMLSRYEAGELVPELRDMLKSGLKLMSDRGTAKKAQQELRTRLGKTGIPDESPVLEQNPNSPGIGSGDDTRLPGDAFTRSTTWIPDDVLRISAVLYKADQAGGSIPSSIREVNRKIADYDVIPGLSPGSKLTHNAVARLTDMFMSFRNKSIKAALTAPADLLGIGQGIAPKDVRSHRRVEAINKIAALGGMGAIVYPTLTGAIRSTTGDPELESRTGGSSHVYGGIEGAYRDPAGYARNTFIPAPVTSTIDALQNNRIIPQTEFAAAGEAAKQGDIGTALSEGTSAIGTTAKQLLKSTMLGTTLTDLYDAAASGDPKAIKSAVLKVELQGRKERSAAVKYLQSKAYAGKNMVALSKDEQESIKKWIVRRDLRTQGAVEGSGRTLQQQKLFDLIRKNKNITYKDLKVAMENAPEDEKVIIGMFLLGRAKGDMPREDAQRYSKYLEPVAGVTDTSSDDQEQE